MSNSAPQDNVPERRQTSVRVLSVPAIGGVVVRFLGGYGGCMTHFRGGRTDYCDGEGGGCNGHSKTPAIWKGFAAVEQWDAVQRLWIPAVLEITESLEEDLRGRNLRGEVWLLARHQKKGEPLSCYGVHCETLAADTLRQPFSVVQVLMRLWHRDEIKLNKPNPLAARVEMEPVAGDAPRLPELPEDKRTSKPDPEDQRAAAELLRRARERVKSTPLRDVENHGSNGKIPH